MKILLKTLAAVATSASLMTPIVAEARTNARMQDACETAIRAELGEGHTRIQRVSTVERDGTARFWLTVRHKTDTAAKSDRYRVLCAVANDDAKPAIELETGWWEKGHRGQEPMATD